MRLISCLLPHTGPMNVSAKLVRTCGCNLQVIGSGPWKLQHSDGKLKLVVCQKIDSVLTNVSGKLRGKNHS